MSLGQIVAELSDLAVLNKERIDAKGARMPSNSLAWEMTNVCEPESPRLVRPPGRETPEIARVEHIDRSYLLAGILSWHTFTSVNGS
jgi:hypothetical protein